MPTPSPTVSYFPSETLSETPSQSPSTTSSSEPSTQPSAYRGEPTHNIVGSDSYLISDGCSSSSLEDMIFDGSTDEFVCERALNSTFQIIVWPKLKNPSIVEKLRVYADHNCSQCDPVDYVIEGREGDSDDWTVISSGDLPWVDEVPLRNEEGISIDNSTYEHGDESLSFTEVIFESRVSIAVDAYCVSVQYDVLCYFDFVVLHLQG